MLITNYIKLKSIIIYINMDINMDRYIINTDTMRGDEGYNHNNSLYINDHGLKNIKDIIASIGMDINTETAPEGVIPNGTIVKVDSEHVVDVVRNIAGGIECKVTGYSPESEMYTLYNREVEGKLVGHFNKDSLIVVETKDGVKVKSINEWYNREAVTGRLTEEDKKDQYNDYVNLQLGISGGRLKRSKKKSRSKRGSLKRKKTMKTKKKKKTRKKKKRSTKRKRR